MSEDLKELEDALINLDGNKAIEITIKIIEENKLPARDVLNTVSRALGLIGELFEKEEYYLAELVYAGDISKKVIQTIEPKLTNEVAADKDPAKKIIVGTVAGDLHDLGKNIVKTFASGAGYEVIDLGSDVPVENFIEKLKELNVKILGISCLLTACDSQLNKVLESLKKEALNDVSVVIGGAAMTELFASNLEKKYGIKTKFAPDAFTGIKIFNELID